MIDRNNIRRFYVMFFKLPRKKKVRCVVESRRNIAEARRFMGEELDRVFPGATDIVIKRLTKVDIDVIRSGKLWGLTLEWPV